MEIKKKILILEDEPLNQELLKLFLANQYLLIFVHTIEQALLEINKQVFDLIISDIKLNGPEDGIYFLNKSKASDMNGKVPVIAFTSISKSTDFKSFKDEGFDGYLPKPTNKKDAMLKIKSLLTSK